MAGYKHKDIDGAIHVFALRVGEDADLPVVEVVTAVPVALGYHRQTVTGGSGSGDATALEGPSGGAIPEGATHVLIDVQGDVDDPGVRLTRDGVTAPTATLGRELPAGSLNEITCAGPDGVPDLTLIQVIAESGSVDIDLEYLTYTTFGSGS